METDENQHGDEVAKLVVSFTRHEIGHWMPKKTARRWKLTRTRRGCSPTARSYFYDDISRTGSGYPFPELLPSRAQSPFSRKVVVMVLD